MNTVILLSLMAVGQVMTNGWVPVPAWGPGHFQYWQHGQCVGWWDARQGQWYPYLGHQEWGPAVSRAPVTPPVADYGVSRGKLSGQQRYSIGGKDVTRDQASDAIGGKDIPDHRAKLRLTVIGKDKTRRDQVVSDVQTQPALAPYRERVIASEYDPDHWHVKGMGYVVTGSPTIYVQDSTGRVLHRQDDYTGGADALAKGLANAVQLAEEAGKVRKPDPLYDPTKDRDRRRPGLLGGSVPWGAIVAAGAGLVALAVFRRKVA